MPRGAILTLRVIAPVLLAIALVGPIPVRAQADPTVLERVIPAAVQIALVGTDEAGETLYLTVASGTTISPDGVILTNAHAVDMAAHREILRLWQNQTPMVLDETRLLILGSDGMTPAMPRFLAEVLTQDATLDLALLHVVADATGSLLDPATLALPWVPLGDSDAIHLAEPIDILSYPVAGGDGLTYTSGAVSGFESDGSAQRMWINTDATLSGGSSGGTAINRAGELVGIPTQGSELDCRPGDTNRDGQITTADVGCIPVGGSIGQLRPINLARGLLASAMVTPPYYLDEGPPPWMLDESARAECIEQMTIPGTILSGPCKGVTTRT